MKDLKLVIVKTETCIVDVERERLCKPCENLYSYNSKYSERCLMSPHILNCSVVMEGDCFDCIVLGTQKFKTRYLLLSL